MEEYKYKSGYDLIDSYVIPKNTEEWLNCPRCGLKPKVWEFDNGSSTGCGCHNSKYDHLSIHAECIGSVLRRTGGFAEFNDNELRDNWNHWVVTGEELFLHAGLRKDNKY